MQRGSSRRIDYDITDASGLRPQSSNIQGVTSIENEQRNCHVPQGQQK